MKTYTRNDMMSNFSDGKVVVPASFTGVDGMTFVGCKGVTEVEFKGSLSFSFDGAYNGLFKDCPNLRKVVFRREPVIYSVGIFKNCASEKVDVYVPADYVKDYSAQYKLAEGLLPNLYKSNVSVKPVRDLKVNKTL